ncbi:MAG: T9SS type A sorting domain-containing protein [Flavobacteriales bacterium]|nr:T9SS type A sorting domain-containing protein [Flavobacteriales bacterium]
MKLKSILLSALAVGASLASFSQCSGLTIEAHEELDGMVGTADLTGYTVYRVYAEMENEDDVLCALYGLIGDDENADGNDLSITSTGDIFQSPFGGTLGAEINKNLGSVPGFEDVIYDSFITINKEDNGSIGLVMSAQTVPDNSTFDNDGFYIDDGAVFATPDAVNTIPVEGRVLVAQITTNGIPTITAGVQTFVNGDLKTEQREQFSATYKDADAPAVSDSAEGFNAYPNPTSNEVTIEYQPKSDKCVYVLYDANGRIADQWTHQANVHRRDLSSLPVGMYHLSIQDGDQIYSESIQVVK